MSSLVSSAYPDPCSQELGLAVVDINAVPAVVGERHPVVDVAAPPPASAADFHDPAYRHAAPEYGEVVDATTAADLGDAQVNGFGTGHRVNLARDARSCDSPPLCGKRAVQ